MGKFHLRDLSGGFNGQQPRHMIQNNQLNVINNSRWRGDEWVIRPGFTLPFNAIPDSREIIEFGEYMETNGDKHLLAFTTEHIYRLLDPGWELRYTAGVNRANTDKWFHTRLLDRHIATNGVDPPVSTQDPSSANYTNISFDTTTDAEGNTGLTISVAKTVTTFNNRLVFGNLTESVDGANNLKVMFSEVNNYNRFHTNSFVNIDETGGEILALAPLGFRRMAVYKEDMVGVIIDRGNPFFFQSIFAEETGLLAPKSFCAVPGGHFFVSNKGFYFFTTSAVEKVGQNKAWREFYNNLNTSSAVAMNNTYCFFDGQGDNQEVYILFCTGASTTPNRVLVMNIRDNDIWSTDDFDAQCGYFDYKKTKLPRVFFGEGSNMRLQGGATDNGVSITTTLETKMFTILPTEENPTPPDIMQMTRVETDALPNGVGNAQVSLLTANIGNETPAVADTQPITDNGVKMPYVDHRPSWGKYTGIRITGFTSVSEIVYWWEGGGNE